MRNRTAVARFFAVLAVIALMSSAVFVAAQGGEDMLTCDAEELIEQQAKLAARLAAFNSEVENEPYGALVALFEVGEAYMALAEECGFSVPELSFDVAAIGDPEHGAEIFSTQYSETGFACATCHRVDSEEQLIGPGLLNLTIEMAIELPEFSDEEIVEYTGVEPDASTEEILIGFIRTSIINPNVFVEEIYPASLMPQNWGEVLSAQDVDDLVAYIVTLVEGEE